VIAFCIQITDITPLFENWNIKIQEYNPPITRDVWNELIGNVDKVIMYPPGQRTYNSNDDYRYFAFYSAENHKPFTAGYHARVDSSAIFLYQKLIDSLLNIGIIDEDAIYITTFKDLDKFSIPIKKNSVNIALLDNYIVFISMKNPFSLPAQYAVSFEEIDTLITYNRNQYQQKIDFIIQRIRNDPEWLEQVENKAIKEGVSVDEMLRKDAEWVLHNQ
jgi:hypothetical protein